MAARRYAEAPEPAPGAHRGRAHQQDERGVAQVVDQQPPERLHGHLLEAVVPKCLAPRGQAVAAGAGVVGVHASRQAARERGRQRGGAAKRGQRLIILCLARATAASAICSRSRVQTQNRECDLLTYGPGA